MRWKGRTSKDLGSGRVHVVKKEDRDGSAAIFDSWVDLEGTMLSEVSQTETNTVWSHLHVESKNRNP